MVAGQGEGCGVATPLAAFVAGASTAPVVLGSVAGAGLGAVSGAPDVGVTTGSLGSAFVVEDGDSDTSS